MKKSEIVFNLSSIPVDIISLLIAGIIAFKLRIQATDWNLETLNWVGEIYYDLSLIDYLLVLGKTAPVLILAFAILGLYNLSGTRRFISEFGRIFIGTSLVLLVVVILFFFNQTLFPSRFIILATWLFSTLFVLIGRYLLKKLQGYLFSKGYGLHNLVLIEGSSAESKALASILKDPQHGYNVIAELNQTSDTDAFIAELEELYKMQGFDELVQANTDSTIESNSFLVEFARSKGLQFSFVPNMFEVQRNVIEMGNFSGVPVISLKNSPLEGWGNVLKRLFDVAASSVCLLITAPIFLIVYLAVKFDSPGPAIYRQVRGGYKRDFDFYKFRTMYTHLSSGAGYGGEEAEKVRMELWQKNSRGGFESPFLKMKDDPRVTRVGRILRKTKLDEIPQFWNVLIGSMSMVGPRAHMIEEVVRYRDQHRRIFSVKPGIFGLSQNAQILWPDLPFDEEIKINTFYIENWSLWLDIKILVKSFYLIFFAKKPEDDY